MYLSFSVKGLNGKAKIDGKSISGSNFFLSLTCYEKEQKYSLAIIFGPGEFSYNLRDEKYWLKAEIAESIISSPNATEAVKGNERLGALDYEVGPTTEKRGESRELRELNLNFLSDEDAPTLSISGTTLEEYTNGSKGWDYEISIGLTREIANILKNMSGSWESRNA